MRIFRRLIYFLNKKVKHPLQKLLLQGLSPEKLALSVVLGSIIGIVPLLGSTTILCGAAAIRFRLNMPAIQLINYLIYPLQLILFIPFLKLGSFLVPSTNIPFSAAEVYSLFSIDFWGTIKDLFWLNMAALLIWGIFSILLGYPLYRFFLKIFRKTLSSKETKAA